MKSISKILKGMGIAVTTTAATHAATITFSQAVTMPNDTDVTILIPQFDATTNMLPTDYSPVNKVVTGSQTTTVGATLESVTVTVTAFIANANVQMDNDAGQAQDGTARVQNLVNNYSGPSTPDGLFQPHIETADMQLNVSQVFNLDATSGDALGSFDVTSFGDYADWSPGSLQAGDSGLVNSAVYGSVYEGTGDLNFTINSTYTTSATFSGNDGYFQGNTPNGSFFVEVTYDFVPEPSSYAALTGLLMLALVGVRRRR
jgi:hypothetical protein